MYVLPFAGNNPGQRSRVLYYLRVHMQRVPGGGTDHTPGTPKTPGSKPREANLGALDFLFPLFHENPTIALYYEFSPVGEMFHNPL